MEEFLEGWEVSIFGLSDGRDFVVLPPCTDFKKAHDGDTGPNTGGMGSICPVPWVDDALMQAIRAVVVEPTYAALRREGLGYAGILYFGLMITSEARKCSSSTCASATPKPRCCCRWWTRTWAR